MPRRACIVVVALALAACGGNLRAYPRWRFVDGPAAQIDAGCALGRAFVRMSGKTGVGLTVELRSRGDCLVRFARAELVLDGQRAPATLPAEVALRGRSLVYVWLPFEFDNNRAWNEGRRRGTFEIELETVGVAADGVPDGHQTSPPLRGSGGTVTPWRIAADHTRPERFVPNSGRRW